MDVNDSADSARVYLCGMWGEIGGVSPLLIHGESPAARLYNVAALCISQKGNR